MGPFAQAVIREELTGVPWHFNLPETMIRTAWDDGQEARAMCDAERAYWQAIWSPTRGPIAAAVIEATRHDLDEWRGFLGGFLGSVFIYEDAGEADDYIMASRTTYPKADRAYIGLEFGEWNF